MKDDKKRLCDDKWFMHRNAIGPLSSSLNLTHKTAACFCFLFGNNFRKIGSHLLHTSRQY